MYAGAFVLAEWLTRHEDVLRGRTAVELGCGVGLTAIGATLCGAARVWATDGDEQLLQLTRRNLEANVKGAWDAGVVRTARLLWGSDRDTAVMKRRLGSSGVDVVLGADIAALVYSDAFGALVDTMRDLCRTNPSSVVLLSYQARHSVEERFWGAVRELFDVQRVLDLHEDFAAAHAPAVHLYQLHLKPDAATSTS